jgi:imidazole glycerol-phosphate synthase subunit HisH
MSVCVGIIDYGAGNIRSLVNALEHLGAQTELVSLAEQLKDVSHVLLPGVGAFGHCMERLSASGMIPSLTQWAIAESKPILGVCVGMQLLTNGSDEMGQHAGLNWIGGRVVRLPDSNGRVRVPHVGWNDTEFAQTFADIPKGEAADFYYDHSYGLLEPHANEVLATCAYGEALGFASAVRRGNIVGSQFHPEKSQTAGLRFLSAFLRM